MSAFWFTLAITWRFIFFLVFYLIQVSYVQFSGDRSVGVTLRLGV